MQVHRNSASPSRRGSTHERDRRQLGLIGTIVGVSAIAATAVFGLLTPGSASASELSWSAAQKIDSTTSPYAYPSLRVSCATASFCAAVDANDNAMLYNGSSWTAPASVKGSVPIRLDAVSCPSSSFCLAGGGEFLTYNGSSWSKPAHLELALVSVSCPSASFCVGVVGGDAFTYNGSSWSAPSEIDSPAEEEFGLGSISCPSSSFCMAADYEGNVVTYNGSWSEPKDIDGSQGIGSVSCPSSSFCMAVDWGGNALTYSGGTWSSPANIDSNVLSSVSCPSASFCAAVGDSGDALTYNGSSWMKSTGVYGGSEGASVSCPTSTFCVATEAHGNAFIYAEHEAPSGGSGGGAGGGGAPPPSVPTGLPEAPKPCVVPNLKGKTLKAAKKRARKADCAVGHVKLLAGVTKKNGRVVEQKPKGGKVKAAGAKITVTLG
jgi:hypothetical protein